MTSQVQIEVDENEGHGGSYVIKNGKRVLVERTEHVSGNVADLLREAKLQDNVTLPNGIAGNNESVTGVHNGTINKKANFTR